MSPRSRFSSSWQIVLAILLGIVGGTLVQARDSSFPLLALKEACVLLGSIFVAGAKLLAVPMVIAAAVEGTVGLEATRGLRRLGWKALVCFAAVNLLVLLLGLALTGTLWMLSSKQGWWSLGSMASGIKAAAVVEVRATNDYQVDMLPASFWPVLALLSLGVGLYRNRIGEGRAHLLLRLWRGVDEILLLLAGYLRRVVPLGVFALTFTAVSEHNAAMLRDSHFSELVFWTVVCWATYGLIVLPLALLLLARINPWRYARPWWPAVATALGSGVLPAALPLALEGARQRTGISDRVASLVLPAGAALQRDGIALGWMACTAFIGTHVGSSPAPRPGALVMLAFYAWVMTMVGTRAGGLALIPATALFQEMDESINLHLGYPDFLLLALWIGRGGAAVSQWSQACVAAVVAYWEGERELLAPKAPDDPLFGERLSKDFI